MFMHESFQVLGIGPFLRGELPDLHQADFLCAPLGSGVETAFSPDNGFDEGRVDAVSAGGLVDGLILAAFEAPISPPKSQRCG